MKKINLPLQKEELLGLKAGDTVLLTGEIFTARDAAHKRFMAELDANGALPLPLYSIYYAGPAPAGPGHVVGPIGPTTSGRMDAYTPRMLDAGLTAMVGKGLRSETVIRAMEGRAVYFAAVGGAASLIARCVKECEVVLYEDLGAEAVRRLWVEDLPVVVAVDAAGRSVYDRG